MAVPVSAPRRVAEHLAAAPDGPVAVLHRVPTAVYVEVAGRCLGVVAPTAAQVPCAFRLSGGVSATAFLAAALSRPYVERGSLYLTDDPLVVGRFVDVRVPRINPDRIPRRAAGPARTPAVPPRPGLAGLAAYTDLPPVPDAATVAGMVGHGDGLTPLGDDVLCGWLAVLHASGHLGEGVEQAVRAAVPRTTLLSATLLDCALHGEALPELATYLRSLGTPHEAAAASALDAIGHSSGSGLRFGADHALATLERTRLAGDAA